MSDPPPALIELVDDPDPDVRAASIWALSQTGGEGVHEIFEALLEESDDEEEQNFISLALDNLIFNQEIDLDMTLLDFPEADDDPDNFIELQEFEEDQSNDQEAFDD